jgi:hypothetical protein
MIRLNSFLHRHTLADITGRWLCDRLEPGDVRTLKELVNYNCLLAPLVLDDVASSIFTEMVGLPVQSFAASTKGALKDFLVAHPPHTSHRIEEMIRRYQKYPQDFYRETPFDGRVYHQSTGDAVQYLGSTRRKRFKRIAEKSARRIIDYVFQEIKEEAETLAHERALQLGVPMDRMITPVSKQEEEFVHAERRIIKRIRTGQFIKDLPQLDINDVFGVKAVCEDVDVQKLTALLERHPRLHILECELHSGSYNSVNLTLRYSVDRDMLRRSPPSGRALEKLVARGLTSEQALRGFERFVEEAEDDLTLEVIATNYLEGLESEIGRSMHEERIMSQRAQEQYHGSLANNVAALLEFMWSLRRHPSDQLDEIPIKLWIKYMPDYYESVMKGTYSVAESVYLAD